MTAVCSQMRQPTAMTHKQGASAQPNPTLCPSKLRNRKQAGLERAADRQGREAVQDWGRHQGAPTWSRLVASMYSWYFSWSAWGQGNEGPSWGRSDSLHYLFNPAAA